MRHIAEAKQIALIRPIYVATVVETSEELRRTGCEILLSSVKLKYLMQPLFCTRTTMR